MSSNPTNDLLNEAFWPVSGPGCLVSLAKNQDGSQPALEFLRECGQDKNLKRDLTKLARYFRMLADQGEIRNDGQFKYLRGTDPKLHEFRAYQIRVFAFQREGNWYLTSGCVKKKDKLDEADLNRAYRIRQEHINRLTAKK